MFAKLLISLLGALIFLFLFWQRLKEDYLPENIFATAFYQLIGIVIGVIIANKFFPQWWFWTIFVFLSISLGIGIARYKLRAFETLEATVFAVIPWFSLHFLFDAIQTSRVSSLLGFLLFLGTIGIFTVIDAKYKSFSWYKSGRVGFTGLVILGLIFLIRAILAVFFTNVLSFAGRGDIILSSIVAFVSFLLLFNLSRKT